MVPNPGAPLAGPTTVHVPDIAMSAIDSLMLLTADDHFARTQDPSFRPRGFRLPVFVHVASVSVTVVIFSLYVTGSTWLAPPPFFSSRIRKSCLVFDLTR